MSPSEESVEKGNLVIALLQDLVKCDAIALTACNPFHRSNSHQLLANRGYADDVLGDILVSFSSDNPGFNIVKNHTPSALRWKDLARDWKFDFTSTSIAERHLLPAGFNEGLSIFLRLPDNNHVGAIHMNWTRSSSATDEHREIVERFHPLLARSTNLLQSLNTVANQMFPNSHVALHESGLLRSLPGREIGPILGRPGFFIHIDSYPHGGSINSFLMLGQDGRTHRIQLVTCANGRTLITEDVIPTPYQLSPRELEVVNMLPGGASNPSIASALSISTSTVATHIENILVKMKCSTRSQIAAIAAEQGIRFLPADSYVEPR